MLVVAVVLDVRANTVRKPSEDHVLVCQYVPVVFILLLGALGSRRAGLVSLVVMVVQRGPNRRLRSPGWRNGWAANPDYPAKPLGCDFSRYFAGSLVSPSSSQRSRGRWFKASNSSRPSPRILRCV